ncbi:MAG: HNH endonuclease [Alphaproteobacteria bacterium]|nr:HNH endonuclease [Alphaproteobacteria bacterium]
MSEAEIIELQKLLVSTQSINDGYKGYDDKMWVVNITKPKKLDGENWKPHPIYSGVEISDLGRVKIDGEIKKLTEVTRSRAENLPITAEILKKRSDIGYVGVKVNGEWKLVYELVAETFLGKRPEGTVIHHKTNDGYDNRPSNLMYVPSDDHLPKIHRYRGATKDYVPLVYKRKK